MISSRIGLPFPECFEGTVHSVFRHSVNIRIPGDLHLYTVHCFEDLILPGSVYARDLVTERIRAGLRAERKGRVLLLGSEQIYIPSEAESFDCRVSAHQIKQDLSALRMIRYPGAGRELSENSASEVYERLGNSLEKLMSALGRSDEAAAGEAARSMVGLGFGLTPSGDDMLCGVLAVLCAFDEEGFRMTAGAVRDNLGRTNDVSASFLTFAAEGCVNSLVKKILDGCDSEEAQEQLSGIGHTSGRDILCGMKKAAEYCIGKSEFFSAGGGHTFKAMG